MGLKNLNKSTENKDSCLTRVNHRVRYITPHVDRLGGGHTQRSDDGDRYQGKYQPIFDRGRAAIALSQSFAQAQGWHWYEICHLAPLSI